MFISQKWATSGWHLIYLFTGLSPSFRLNQLQQPRAIRPLKARWSCGDFSAGPTKVSSIAFLAYLPRRSGLAVVQKERDGLWASCLFSCRVQACQGPSLEWESSLSTCFLERIGTSNHHFQQPCACCGCKGWSESDILLMICPSPMLPFHDLFF